jgi:cation diffusion facilitator family transporter
MQAQHTPLPSDGARATAHAAAASAVQRVALYGIVVSVGLVTLTVTVATVSHSFALTATAVDSAVDIVAAVVLWLGLRLSERKTRTFPYGLYKVENVLQIVVAVLIFIAAYEIARRAFAGAAPAPEIDWLVIAGTAVVIGGMAAYSRYATRAGRRTGSPALVADGRHHLTDVFSTTLALVAVVSTYAGFDIDRPAAFVILGFAVWSGWGLLVAGMKVLLDASVDAGTLRHMERILASDPLVTEVESVAARSAGRYLFVEATLHLRTTDLSRAHSASERLEAQVRSAIPAVDRVSLHLEPQPRGVLHVAVPLRGPEGTIADEFGEAPFFALADLRVADGEVVRQEVLANPHRQAERQKGILVAEWLVAHGVDTLLTVRDVNKGPGYVLGEAGVETRRTRSGTLIEELDLLRAGRG